MVVFILSFLICFISYYLHTLWHYQTYKGVDFRQRSNFFNVFTHIIVFGGYLAFGCMIFTDPFRIKIDIILRMIGLIIGSSGLIISAVATVKKKGYSETDFLIESGIYSRLRNPMYLGIIFIHTGFPLFFESMITLLSSFIWIPAIILWKYWEEKHLVKKLGEQYIQYKKRTLF